MLYMRLYPIFSRIEVKPLSRCYFHFQPFVKKFELLLRFSVIIESIENCLKGDAFKVDVTKFPIPRPNLTKLLAFIKLVVRLNKRLKIYKFGPISILSQNKKKRARTFWKRPSSQSFFLCGRQLKKYENI